MSVTVGVLRERAPGERRVAMVPRAMDLLAKSGVSYVLERGAGVEAGFPDMEYEAKGVRVLDTPEAVLAACDVLAAVRVDPAAPYEPRHTVIGFCDPLSLPAEAQTVARRGAALLSMELMPRITRAQSMDALSSMATIAGYKAVLLAAASLPRMFPLLMTAAGTIPAAKVFIVGAGVAGLQAIATARRLGAVVTGYDVRAAVREQIESLGAKFAAIDIGGSGEGSGGYAKELAADALRRQQEQMAAVVASNDVVITTAAVPGRKAPILITAEMARGMAPGSVIVDLAAERGGNCELTRAGETVVDHGVTILGPMNLPASVPYHASSMYARNMATFLKLLIKDGALALDLEDEIVRDTLVTRGGEVVHPRVKALLTEEVKA